MRTQQFLKKFRRMGLMVFFGALSFSVMAGMSNDGIRTEKPGGGESSEAKQQETIELESWMMETPFLVTSTVEENTIELESWMVNRDNFRITEELEMEFLEDWMLRPESFQTIEEKRTNAIEEWMTDKNFWNI
ncbi:MAG TPA: hypothetical protein VJ876_07965 [Bacteroidales bacterium]|nr:hypothetical protein [Bacteroidales bacterium]